MTRVPSDVAFTAAVKAQQSARGSRDMFERMEDTRPWPDRITPDLAEFVAAQRSVYLGTASAAGQPYIQHRGGPPGFLRVVDDTHLGFADLRGNQQYITLGNLAENPHAFLFLIDYTNARRVKLCGTAKVVEDDPALLESLVPADGKGRPERAILFQIAAWDVNCPQHIPQRFEAEDVAAALARRDARIAELEAEIARLKA